MRFYKTRRLRIISGASLLLLLIGIPAWLGFTRPGASLMGDAPQIVVAYATGLSSLGVAGMVAFALAAMFSLWLLNDETHHVGTRYLGRRRRNIIETLRTMAIVFGAAGLIVGSLAGLYAAMIHARPDLYNELPLPFFTAELALISLFGGGLVYAAGRLGRW